MKYQRLLLVLGVGLVGCAAAPDEQHACGMVSTYLAPDPAQDYYRLVVTHLDGKPVISKPNYLLPPGEHLFKVSELIDSPELQVRLAARTPKEIQVKVVANQRYQLAAHFNTDRRYSGDDSGYWMPTIRVTEAVDCTLPEDN